MIKWIDAKHISKQGNNLTKHGIYFGNTNPLSSFRDYMFGYVEINSIAIITFIKYLK